MRPQAKDHIPYFGQYIDLVPEEDVMTALYTNHTRVLEFIKNIPAEKEDHRYADNKWTVKQVLGHVIDTERIFCYRALCFARGEQQVLPGFDENVYTANMNLSNTDLVMLAEEFDVVRKATTLFYKQLDEKELLTKGRSASGENNVLSIGFVICGHAMHHLNVIKERYL